MPRKGENIYKRKDGRWEGRFIKNYRPGGKAIYGYVYGYTYKEAKEKLYAASVGASPRIDAKANPSTFADLSEKWMEGRKLRVKESTYNKYYNLLYGYVIPYIGNIRVDAITYETIERLCQELLQNGGKQKQGLSRKTVADVISIVKNIMRFSQQTGAQHALDLQLIRVKQLPKELRILSTSEQSTLYSYLLSNPSICNFGILICMMTGLRIGEVCALRWEDISFADHTIHIQNTIQRIQTKADPAKKTTVILTSPKSSFGKRIIPMPETLEQILFEIGANKTGFVLSSDGTHYTEPRLLQYHFQKVSEKLDIQQINFHALRHTFATRCIEVGFDVKSLSEILGHSSVSITMNRYVHPSLDLKRENMQRISAIFSVK